MSSVPKKKFRRRGDEGFRAIFTERQFEIILRRLHGERLSKTEQEYYFRTIKKKIAALANKEGHDIANIVLIS